MSTEEHTGVWLSNVPLDANEGAFGDTLLGVELDLTYEQLRLYGWVQDGAGYREWLIPAQIINAKATVRILEED
jgi:hypothetical protein